MRKFKKAKAFVSILLISLVAVSSVSAFYTTKSLLDFEFFRPVHCEILLPINVAEKSPFRFFEKEFTRFKKAYEAHRCSGRVYAYDKSFFCATCYGASQFICYNSRIDIASCAYAVARLKLGGDIYNMEELGSFVQLICYFYQNNRYYPSFEINKMCSLLGLIFDNFQSEELRALIRTVFPVRDVISTEEELRAFVATHSDEPMCKALWDKFFKLDRLAIDYAEKFPKQCGE